jgi:hypothetical protein
MAAREVRNLVFLYKSFEIFKGILHVKTRIILMSPSICYMSSNLARKTSENSSKNHPYSILVVVKEVITKRCFEFRVDAQRSL